MYRLFDGEAVHGDTVAFEYEKNIDKSILWSLNTLFQGT
jgi:hypothetical protein